MSLSVLSAPLVTGSGTVAAEGGGFVAPSTGDFFWPVIGGDSSWAITRPAIMMLISVGLIAWFFLSIRQLRLVPTKGQFVIELVYDFVRNTIGRDVIGSKDFRRFLPLLMTFFSLVLVNNLFGIIPFIQFPSMSRIGFPIVLTLIIYVVYHTVALRTKGGVWPYLKSLVPDGVPGWCVPVVWVLEFMTYFIIRPLTLALRLFGNMLAGHLLLLVFVVAGSYLTFHSGSIPLAGAGVLSYAFAIVMSFFELLVQFLQAFIFTMLAALYLADAVSESH